MKTTKISEVLDQKGRRISSIGKNESVASAAKKMVDDKIGSLIVTHGGGIAGIITERDCLRLLAQPDRSAKETKVHELMTSDIVVAQAHYTLEQCLSIMTEKRCRHLPVLQGEEIVGIISIGDLVRAAVEVQRAEIHFLNEYIRGDYPGVAAVAN
ncbi:MAG: CBS domain-containing protein [bacterium]